MAQRRKPAKSNSDPRSYRTRDYTFEVARMTGTPEQARITGRVLLMQNNGTLEGAIGIQRKRTENTLEIQHWTNLFYTSDWVPIKWIIPVTKSDSEVKLGNSYVEVDYPVEGKRNGRPILPEREQKQMSVLREVIEKELAEIKIPKKPLSPALKGQVKKEIASDYYAQAEKIGKDVYFSKLELALPWRVE